jgi:ferredoxin--NADP+ reductase
MSESNSHAQGPVAFRKAEMHLYRPTEPVLATVVRNDLCTSSKKAAGFVRHIELDVAGTLLEGKCLPGQSIGVLAEGLDATGKPHKLRLYSLASPTRGEDGAGKVVSTTVKRTIDEHWDTHGLFLGVCSNYLCDRKVGDKVRVSGPNGKKFVLPEDVNAADYFFVATGTGIAPFRGMVIDLLESGCTRDIVLLMGAPYATDLLYHDFFTGLAQRHANFRYITAISRERNESHDRLYVQDRLTTERDRLLPILSRGQSLVYICGLAGMELGVFQQLALLLSPGVLGAYLEVDNAAMSDVRRWSRSMIHKEVRPTRRVLMEVYA